MAYIIPKNSIDEVDSAYQVLKAAGHPLYYRELIDQAIAAKGGTARASAHTIADVHTRINLDSRFVHTGKSMWGLNEWSPQRISVLEAEETATAQPDMQRRAKLFAAIQQDFENEGTASNSDPDHLLEGETELEEENEETEV
ncbi:DNA-directed RNA polymerase subunit delta [Sporomusa silvacetica DSM 10669]|uniref:RNAP delta factor n=1 Tax=Sporomusa silvacetica DSM 10669 TaxID=1123289 RepID=A0ABZ3IFU8_9FIRM|nr:DNA-directed RNA polymerase subunit delta [Sporomusa silvacetica]OZC17780.1 putative DNA-directed RNA polymerase subunit delta [Sporomusa silvacetica DSM 10669]